MGVCTFPPVCLVLLETRCHWGARGAFGAQKQSPAVEAGLWAIGPILGASVGPSRRTALVPSQGCLQRWVHCRDPERPGGAHHGQHSRVGSPTPNPQSSILYPTQYVYTTLLIAASWPCLTMFAMVRLCLCCRLTSHLISYHRFVRRANTRTEKNYTKKMSIFRMGFSFSFSHLKYSRPCKFKE